MTRLTLHLAIALAMSVPVSGLAKDFDWSSYVDVPLDVILAEPPPAEDGMDVFIRKRQFEASLASEPEKCTAVIVGRLLRMRGVEGIPEVSHCASVRSPEGLVVPMYVEDVLVRRLRAHAKPGKRIRLSVIYLYSVSGTGNKGFLVTGFVELPETAKSGGRQKPER